MVCIIKLRSSDLESFEIFLSSGKTKCETLSLYKLAAIRLIKETINSYILLVHREICLYAATQALIIYKFLQKDDFQYSVIGSPLI
jgi:hypothetical protein